MTTTSMKQLWQSSHIAAGNASYIEDLYEKYLANPNSVPSQWRDYFDRLPVVQSKVNLLEDVPHSLVQDNFAQISKMRVRTDATAALDSKATAYERRQVNVVQLISSYRQRGHQKAQLDPLKLQTREPIPDLDLAFHDLTFADLETQFQVGSLHIGKSTATLEEIVESLEKTYCNTVGAEFMHIVDSQQQHWIMNRMESVRSSPVLDEAQKMQILRRLIKAEGLEKSLASKYPGTKRFGLEGGNLIPMLSELVQRRVHMEPRKLS